METQQQLQERLQRLILETLHEKSVIESTETGLPLGDAASAVDPNTLVGVLKSLVSREVPCRLFEFSSPVDGCL